jgi:2-desacetyl-2-hydroxyethyl bacteriochlorophyllide A dehydrogenase
MRAAIVQGPDLPLKIETLPDPIPDSGQLVFKIARCGICGTDVHMTSGHGVQYEAGTVPGHEYAGEVVAVGASVTRFKVGDRISAMPLTGCGECQVCREGMPQFCDQRGLNGGGFAEYAKAGVADCILLPQSLSMDDGALVEPMAVGYHGVAISGMQPGAKVLVIGAGPIGLAAIFWARRFQAGKIAVAARSRAKQHYAELMGCDMFLDPSRPLAETVVDALGGAPDIIFECAGVPGMLNVSVETVRRRGTVVVLGFCTQPDSFVPAMAVDKEIRFQFSMTYSLKEFEDVARTFDAGHVEARTMISDRVALSDLPDFFERLHHTSDYAKVMIDTSA